MPAGFPMWSHDASRMVWLLMLLQMRLCISVAAASDWPQFRGPNGSATDPSNLPLPVEIGVDRHVLWKSALPPGHSSPIVAGNRIFVTAVQDQKLLTIALDRATGKQQWESPAPYDRLETIHRIGSHAQSTPCADAELLFSFFGSSGLYCHDHSGKLIWNRPMGPFLNDFGAASSPILAGDRLILCQDHDLDSFLVCFDKRTGEELWKTDRSEFLRNSCTPILWNNDGRQQIVVAATLRVVGYDLETGKEAWTVRGISRTVVSSPTIGADGNLYLAGWAAGGDEAERIRVEPFDDVAALKDKDKNGSLEEQELGEGPVYQRYSQADRNKDGHLTRTEYETVPQSVRSGAKSADEHSTWRGGRCDRHPCPLDISETGSVLCFTSALQRTALHDQRWWNSSVFGRADGQGCSATTAGGERQLLRLSCGGGWKALPRG